MFIGDLIIINIYKLVNTWEISFGYGGSKTYTQM